MWLLGDVWRHYKRTGEGYWLRHFIHLSSLYTQYLGKAGNSWPKWVSNGYRRRAEAQGESK